MITPSREQIAVALFTQLKTAGTAFKTYSRRPQLWNESVAFPALFMGNTHEDYTYQNATASPAHVTLDFQITLYTKTALDPNVTPDTEINNLLDAVEAAMQPPAYQPFKQTLGGIVDHAWIEGAILRVPGYLDGQGGVYFTIRVLVPS